ncbi:MAG: P-II family nitrogen regulator [Sphaerochaetaceae bacterium]|nr:P-II family nitrogen regulator [Sphaerochaetaceae bacterium]
MLLRLADRMLLAIVEHDKGELFAGISRMCGSTGASVVMAKGTASNKLLYMLGLGSEKRDVVLTVTDEKTAVKIVNEAKKSNIRGVSAYIGKGDDDMDTQWKLITIIVNAGYADDVMDVARKAGASGGTVTHARGTSKQTEDSRFLNINIVPEKDMIMIIAKNDETEKIINSVTSMKCLQEPGVGVVFTQDVKYFDVLGDS